MNAPDLTTRAGRIDSAMRHYRGRYGDDNWQGIAQAAVDAAGGGDVGVALRVIQANTNLWMADVAAKIDEALGCSLPS